MSAGPARPGAKHQHPTGSSHGQPPAISNSNHQPTATSHQPPTATSHHQPTTTSYQPAINGCHHQQLSPTTVSQGPPTTSVQIKIKIKKTQGKLAQMRISFNRKHHCYDQHHSFFAFSVKVSWRCRSLKLARTKIMTPRSIIQ